MIKVTPKPIPMPQPKPSPRRLPPAPMPLPKPIPRCPPRDWPFPPKGDVTLSLGDRFKGARLDEVLSGPGLRLREAMTKAGTAFLKRGLDGQVRGPEGQPLVTVHAKDGRTLYVDPNTNQYYVAQPQKLDALCKPSFGVAVRGPYELPKDAQFSNSHFSDADCRELTRLARGGSVFEHKLPPSPVLL